MMGRLKLPLVLLIAGCGYTTQGFIYEGEKLYIKPVVNTIDIAGEKRRYSTYAVYPVLLEKKLTNALINKFNIDGHLRVSKEPTLSLRLECEIYKYEKETLNYTDAQEVKEQRLRLYVNTKLYRSQGKLLKEKDIIGETSFFLTGPHSKLESDAQADLIEDTSRRILEFIIEEWPQ